MCVCSRVVMGHSPTKQRLHYIFDSLSAAEVKSRNEATVVTNLWSNFVTRNLLRPTLSHFAADEVKKLCK